MYDFELTNKIGLFNVYSAETAYVPFVLYAVGMCCVWTQALTDKRPKTVCARTTYYYYKIDCAARARCGTSCTIFGIRSVERF